MNQEIKDEERENQDITDGAVVGGILIKATKTITACELSDPWLVLGCVKYMDR